MCVPRVTVRVLRGTWASALLRGRPFTASIKSPGSGALRRLLSVESLLCSRDLEDPVLVTAARVLPRCCSGSVTLTDSVPEVWTLPAGSTATALGTFPALFAVCQCGILTADLFNNRL